MSLDEVLGLCPPSDERQRQSLEEEYGLSSPNDLSGAVVFGTGKLGAGLARQLRDQGLSPLAFSDNDRRRWGTAIEGLPVIPPAELPSTAPIIVASKFVKDIVAGLSLRQGLHLVPHYLLPVLWPALFPSAGFHALTAERVYAATPVIGEVYARLSDEASRQLFLRLLRFRLTMDPGDLPDPEPDQYFPRRLWSPDPHEVYVDVGACGGDTLADFLRASGGVFDAYYAYEPDPGNLATLRRAVGVLNDPRVVVRACAAGDRRGSLTFAGGLGGESRVAEAGALSVEVVTLDQDLAGVCVTALKLDTEGFETQVLDGARDIIRDRGPKLAVSVYHRPQDLWELPAWVAACRSDYSQHLQHHTAEAYDTVLYCSVEGAA
jgi:FkbM family methyltransferase